MEDRVDGSEGIGESEGEGVGASLSDDIIGAKVLFGELFQGTSSSEVFGFDEDLVTDFEVWCWRLAFVSGDLVLFLSVRDCQLELLVKFVEVYYC